MAIFLEAELKVARRAARAAGKVVMSYYDKRHEVEQKATDGKSPVTEADLASEQKILPYLKQFGYGVLSEENADDNDRLNKDRVWIIDPIDGTMDFMQKTGEFAIMIGLAEKGKPVLGVVYQPTEDKLYWAVKGQGAFQSPSGGKGEKKLSVSRKTKWEDMTLLVSRNHLRDQEVRLSEKLGLRIKKHGSTMKACLVAEGRGDIYLNTSDRTGEWDTCACEVIVAEAGGKFTDMDGQDLAYNKDNPKNPRGFVVTNGVRHGEIIGELQKTE